MIYSGFIECGGQEADYEFESSHELNTMEQLDWLINSGVLQIIDNPPREEEDEDEN